MRKRLGLRSRVVGLLTVSAAALAAIFVFAGPSAATTGGSLDWNHVNGATACAPDTTGTMLWIFNPHSDAVPTDLTITWNLSGGGTFTHTYTGWTNPGNGQNWHLTVDIPTAVDTGTTAAVLPPASATLDFTGTLGSNAILTISGCNEGGGGGPPPAAAPTVSKTAAQNANTEFGWTIGKAVDKSEIDTTPGTTATFHYTVTLTGSAGTPTIGDVTGTITVFNNANGDINLATLTDQLSDGTDCTVDTSGDPTLLIAANSSKDFPYSCGLSAYPTDYPNTMNTVSMTWNAQDLSDGSHLDAGSGGDSVPVDFTTSVTDNCATATDTFNGGAADPLGTYCADDGSADTTGVTLDNFSQSYTAPTWTITYSRTVPAPATLGSCHEYDNEADFADNSKPQNTGSASASATVCAFNSPLTIGYWKTHMSLCGPHVKTGTNGCNNNGPFTSDFLGHTICNGTCVAGKLSSLYSADTTTKALAVFNGNNCANSGASNSNAAACLAAQLLGAELNVANIANPCICDTINQAIDFLTHVGYNGPGSAVTFNASYTRAGAIALKTALDNYNNGLGCP